jgi:hypothetical protein
MTTLFFLLAILFIFHELNILTRTEDNMRLVKKIREKDFFTKKKPDVQVLDGDRNPFSEEMITREHNETKARGCLLITTNMMYMAWVFMGVALAHQWQIFLLLLSGSVSYSLISKIVSEDGKIVMKKIDALIGMIILIWIFMNHFHPGFFPTHLI